MEKLTSHKVNTNFLYTTITSQQCMMCCAVDMKQARQCMYTRHIQERSWKSNEYYIF
jgi:hypothetical protein